MKNYTNKQKNNIIKHDKSRISTESIVLATISTVSVMFGLVAGIIISTHSFLGIIFLFSAIYLASIAGYIKLYKNQIITHIKNKKRQIIIFLITLTIIDILICCIAYPNNKHQNDKIEIKNSPGSIATIGQKGNNVIIKKDDNPKLELKLIYKNKLENNLYKSEIELNILSKYKIAKLYLEIRSPNIIDLEVEPMQIGISHIGVPEIKEDYIFTNLYDTRGKFKLVILANREIIKFDIRYNISLK